MNKKFIASVLAVTMLVGMSAPVMADSDHSYDYDAVTKSGTFTVSGEGTMQKPDVKITVPTESDFVINPYKVGLDEETLAKFDELTAEQLEVLKSASGNQIISKKGLLKNDGNVNVAVSIEGFCVKTGGDYVEKDAKRVLKDGSVSGNWVGGFPISVATSSVAKKKKAAKAIQLNMVLKADDSLAKKVTIKGVPERKAVKKNGKISISDGNSVSKKRAIVIPKGSTGSISFTGTVNEEPVKWYSYTKANGKTAKDYEVDLWKPSDEVSVTYKLVLTPTSGTK